MGCNLQSFNSPHFAFSTFLMFLFLLEGSTVAGQILDVSYPILITDSEQSVVGSDSKSYFGYSVSLAQGKPGVKFSDDPDGWIFIGAPKSNASEKMYSKPSPNEPGVIWRCSLGLKSSAGGVSCSMVNIDPVPGNTRPNGPRLESHDGAWVGVSMEVNYNHLLTCGMRWNRGNQHFNGICYWFSDTNTTDNQKSSFRSSDLSKLVDLKYYDQRLAPFFKKDKDVYKYDLFQFINRKNDTARGHEWQASQAGLSLHLFLDESLGSTMPNLLIGAPGVREWSGAVVRYTNAKNPPSDLTRPNRNPSDNTFSEFVVGNRGIIPKAGMKAKKNYWNEYFGYSVTSGRYFQKNEVLYASGAPRADHNGQVIIFEFPPHEEPSDMIKRQIKSRLDIYPPKNSFGSYFGSVLHSADLDQNGLDELIVGAPLYTFFAGVSKDGSQQDRSDESFIKNLGNFGHEYGDHGCVFVYKFKNEEGTNIRNQSLQTLYGSRTPRARFGSSIMSLKFNLKNSNETVEIYLVIGAPYETHDSAVDSNSGAVYIYLYNKATGLFGEYSQRIVASKMSKIINGFGSTLGIPEDIDFNDTPDMAIGSYKSGHAVILRTRPKIILEGWVEFFSSDRREIKEVRRGASKFYLKSCFRVAEKLGIVQLTLDIWVKVKFSDPTIKFAPDLVARRAGNTDNELIYGVTANAYTSESCEDLAIMGVHREGIGMNDSDTLIEIKHPFHFIQEVWYNETLNHPLSVLSYYVRESRESRQFRLQDGSLVDFHAFNARKPSPEMSRISADLPISLTDCQDFVCRPDIKMSWSFYNVGEDHTKITSFEVGATEEVKLVLMISNHGESAPNPNLAIDWSNTDITESLTGSRYLSQKCTNETKLNGKNRKFECPLGRYIKKGRNITIEIQFTMKNIFVKQYENFPFIINGAVSFPERRSGRFEDSGRIDLLVPPTMITVTGSRENETLRNPYLYKALSLKESPKGTEDETVLLYVTIRQGFTIEVEGASVKNAVAQIKVPVVSTTSGNNPPQLILVRQPPKGNGISCEATSKRFGFHIVHLVNATGDATDVGIRHANANNLISDIFPDAYRKRRSEDLTSSEENITTTSIPITEGSQRSTIEVDRVPLQRSPKRSKMELAEDALKLSCSDSEEGCLEITCKLQNVKANTHKHISLELLLVKPLIDELLKSSKKSSLLIESTGVARIFNGEADHIHHSDSDVAQTSLVQSPSQGVSLLVYIISGLGGILLLAIIIGVLYKFGFFKREKREQLANLKAEHHRKSMIATARMSMMQDAGSNIGLTETEHHNEDTEPGKK